MSCSFAQQVEYSGLIKRVASEEQDSEEENGMEQEIQDKDQSFTVEYGITSLVDKKTLLQPGDKVCSTKFLLAKNRPSFLVPCFSR